MSASLQLRLAQKLASGPNTYYLSQAPLGVGAADWYVGLGYYYWGAITVAQAGLCTSIGAYQSTAGVDSAKFALYNGSGSRIAASGGAIVTATGWVMDTGVSVAVTPGTYRVAFAVAAGGTVGWEYNTNGANNDGGKDTEAYIAGFPSTLDTSNTGIGGMLTVRMFVQ